MPVDRSNGTKLGRWTPVRQGVHGVCTWPATWPYADTASAARPVPHPPPPPRLALRTRRLGRCLADRSCRYRCQRARKGHTGKLRHSPRSVSPPGRRRSLLGLGRGRAVIRQALGVRPVRPRLLGLGRETDTPPSPAASPAAPPRSSRPRVLRAVIGRRRLAALLASESSFTVAHVAS